MKNLKIMLAGLFATINLVEVVNSADNNDSNAVESRGSVINDFKNRPFFKNLSSDEKNKIDAFKDHFSDSGKENSSDSEGQSKLKDALMKRLSEAHNKTEDNTVKTQSLDEGKEAALTLSTDEKLAEEHTMPQAPAAISAPVVEEVKAVTTESKPEEVIADEQLAEDHTISQEPAVISAPIVEEVKAVTTESEPEEVVTDEKLGDEHTISQESSAISAPVVESVAMNVPVVEEVKAATIEPKPEEVASDEQFTEEHAISQESAAISKPVVESAVINVPVVEEVKAATTEPEEVVTDEQLTKEDTMPQEPAVTNEPVVEEVEAVTVMPEHVLAHLKEAVQAASNFTEATHLPESQDSEVPSQIIERVRIVKVYPVYDAALSAFESVKLAAKDMISYVYNFMKNNKKNN